MRRRVLSGLFPRSPMSPRPRLPAPELSRAWREVPERRSPDREEQARADIALRLLGNIEPSDRALSGWGGWMKDSEP